jgi:hypothetical protein
MSSNQFSKSLSLYWMDRYVENRKRLNPYTERVMERERKSWLVISLKCVSIKFLTIVIMNIYLHDLRASKVS